MTDRECPSTHGKILGDTLANMAEAGKALHPDFPEPCLTCAFRRGCMTNMMAVTGLVAMKCTIGADTDRFACHHGMNDGTPTRICVGYLLAKSVPFDFVQAEMAKLSENIKEIPSDDHIRASFDAWAAERDPNRELDDYALARAYAVASARQEGK